MPPVDMLSAFVIGAMICFFAITAWRAWRWSRMPMHSRLDLYPIPKEGAGRADYGGSYFEDPKWWCKPRAEDKLNETKDILMEMVFIRKLFKNQKSLWWASESFHVGIYVMFCWTLLLILTTLFWFEPLLLFSKAVGVVGFLLATVGAAALLIRRLAAATLRKYTTPQEYFNLAFILIVLATGIACWTGQASPFAVAAGILGRGEASFSPLVGAHLVLLGLMLVYIPASKMSHYVGKFFAFHKVLWDNDPNKPGNKVNQRLTATAAHVPRASWGAPHINPGNDEGK